VTIYNDNDNGVLAAEGGRLGGWTLFLRNGTLVYAYNYLGGWGGPRDGGRREPPK
jgi:arylsulfatase